jgi:hypothetical protein
VVEVDEIKKYLNYHYVSALEVVWCIFKFDMHEWFPTIERLQYHLPNQQMVLLTMTMMCRKWQHSHPFPEQC